MLPAVSLEVPSYSGYILQIVPLTISIQFIYWWGACAFTPVINEILSSTTYWLLIHLLIRSDNCSGVCEKKPIVPLKSTVFVTLLAFACKSLWAEEKLLLHGAFKGSAARLAAGPTPSNLPLACRSLKIPSSTETALSWELPQWSVPRHQSVYPSDCFLASPAEWTTTTMWSIPVIQHWTSQ